MEDQGRRLLLAVAIAFGLMLVWQWLFPPQRKPKPDAAAEPAVEEAQSGAEGDGAGRGEEPGEEAAGPRGPERRYELAFDKFTVQFSTYGGALASWKLTEPKFADRSVDGHPPLELVRAGDDPRWRPFDVWFVDSTYGIPAAAEWTPVVDGQWAAGDDGVLRPAGDAPAAIAFEYRSPALRVTKRYRFIPEDYLVEMTVDVEKLAPGDARESLAISTFQFQEPSSGKKRSFGGQLPRMWEAACYANGSVRHATLAELTKSDRGQTGEIRWAGFAHPYFLAALSPRNDTKERLACNARAVRERDGVMEMTLLYPEIVIRDGDPVYSRVVTGYFGPKFIDRLQQVSSLVGYDTAFEGAIELGKLAIIGKPMLWLLKQFHAVVGNWGVAIILLTIVIQALTLPWTTKSMRSMKAMSRLRPQMEKIREKYKDDKQRQQVEMMNLYKAHKVNPLAGCLPMVLQMPIWFALYRSLRVAAELYQAPFIPGWLDDLTAPDPYYVMPILLLGMMFLQTKLQPTPVESGQQKLMMYGMPLMFGFFSLYFPSGLTLYILTNTVLRTAHQVYLNRTDPGGAGGPAGSGAPDPGQGAASSAARPATRETGPRKQRGKRRGRR
ncbi:MAG: membrane protein insertase YidC [Deltaproteobacteria bacterium]|nr:MAG: membrane protein insertase YidC [Deltaproteobacteria bacterium]